MQDFEPNPGEANTRRRVRRQLYYFAFSLALGGVLGALLAASERGEGNFFTRDYANLTLDPPIAVLLAALIAIGFIALPLWGFHKVDELLVRHNLVAYTGGCIAVIAGYPIWVVLHAGGFVEHPHAFGLFLLAFISMIGSFLFAKIMDRIA